MNNAQSGLLALGGEWARASLDSDLGLWWLADDVRELLPGATEDEVRATTLRVLEPLLASGSLCAIDLLERGAFRVWEGDSWAVVRRIDQEWRRLNRPPNIGEVVWFIAGKRADES